MKLIAPFALTVLAVAVAACEPIDTSALQDIQETAAQAQATAEMINTRSGQIQQAVEDPLGALRATVGATLAKTPTDQPGVYVLTDLQTGCQFLGTYAADGATVSSIAPRVEAVAGGGTRQRCVAVPGAGARSEAEAEG